MGREWPFVREAHDSNEVHQGHTLQGKIICSGRGGGKGNLQFVIKSVGRENWIGGKMARSSHGSHQ